MNRRKLLQSLSLMLGGAAAVVSVPRAEAVAHPWRAAYHADLLEAETAFSVLMDWNGLKEFGKAKGYQVVSCWPRFTSAG